VLKDIIQTYVGSAVQIVDSAIATAKTVEAVLKEKKIQTKNRQGSYQFLVTDQPQRFARLAEIFYGEPIDSSAIELVDAINSSHHS
jgi:glutamate racemase